MRYFFFKCIFSVNKIGNIGDVLIRTGEIEEAAKMYQRQLTLARQYRERTMEATSYGALGLANRLMKKFDKALGYHTQELTLRQEICDMLGNFTIPDFKNPILTYLGLTLIEIACAYIDTRDEYFVY